MSSLLLFDFFFSFRSLRIHSNADVISVSILSLVFRFDLERFNTRKPVLNRNNYYLTNYVNKQDKKRYKTLKKKVTERLRSFVFHNGTVSLAFVRCFTVYFTQRMFGVMRENVTLRGSVHDCCELCGYCSMIFCDL